MMGTGFLGILIAGAALDGRLWFGMLILVLGNLVMMAAGQRLLDSCMDEGFVSQTDIEEAETAIEEYDTIEQEFILRNRRDNTFSVWVTEVRGY